MLIHPKAVRELQALEAKDRRSIDKAIMEMLKGPLTGDVRWLKPAELGQYRKRIGRWRIFFEVEVHKRVVFITAVRPRTSTTY